LHSNSVLAEDARTETSSAELAAEVLFIDGVKLMKQGRCAEAAAKFRASQRLGPASGTLLNLAYCEVQLDQPASAWLTYRQALALAQTSQKPRHAQIAREQADKLEPELPRLVITAAGAEARELVVELDGARLTRTDWSLPVPVDPGEHSISTRLESGEPWQTAFRIGRAQRVVIEIPLPATPSIPTEPPPSATQSSTPARDVTRPAPVVPPNPIGAAPATVSSAAPLAPPPRAESPRGPLWAFGVAMAGAGALTAGAALFASARVSYDSARSHCGSDNACPDAYYDAERDAIGRMRLSLVLAGSGVVLSGVRAWLYWRPPRKSGKARASVSAFVSPVAAGIRGNW
jgi:hypothetical protein